MSDLHLNFSAQPHEQPGDDDAREARHQILATLLGAYADGELPPETASHIDAHLLGCAPCRREVEVHVAVRERLSREPLSPSSDAFRQRIIEELAHTDLPLADPVAGERASLPWWRSSRAGIAAAMIAVAVLAAGLREVGLSERRTVAPAVTIDAMTVPLLNEVIADYRRVTLGDLPGRARDLDAVRSAVPFPVEPIAGDSTRLLAVWNTALEGEPAAVLAYRWRDQLVFAYLVPEAVFFRHSSVRTPVAAGAMISARNGPQRMLAWAASHSGVILVGDVPLEALMALRRGDAAR